MLIDTPRHIAATSNSSRSRGISRRGRRTDSSGLDHVADGESLDGLVLGSASRAVGASDGLDVTTALLVTSARMRNFALVHFDDCVCAYSKSFQSIADSTVEIRIDETIENSACLLGRSLLDHFDFWMDDRVEL